VKSFARRVITPTLLGICATTTSSVPILHIATFCISRTGSLHFHFTLQYWFSCFLKKPEQRSCPLNAVRCVTSKSGCPLHFVSRGGDPLDFTTVKVIFDTSMRIHLRSTPLLIPYSYSTYKCLQLLLPCRSAPIRENQHHKAV
jgi:hypothetical protein